MFSFITVAVNSMAGPQQYENGVWTKDSNGREKGSNMGAEKVKPKEKRQTLSLLLDKDG